MTLHLPDHPLDPLLRSKRRFEEERRRLFAMLADYAAARATHPQVAEALARYETANAQFVDTIRGLERIDPAAHPLLPSESPIHALRSGVDPAGAPDTDGVITYPAGPRSVL